MSRRYRNHVQPLHADPKALPGKPVELDDSNSYTSPYGCRTAKVLNTRAVVVATAKADQTAVEARRAEEAAAAAAATAEAAKTAQPPAP